MGSACKCISLTRRCTRIKMDTVATVPEFRVFGSVMTNSFVSVCVNDNFSPSFNGTYDQ
jgi:hypothetical protein